MCLHKVIYTLAQFSIIIISILFGSCLNNSNESKTKVRDSENPFTAQIIRLPVAGQDTLKTSLFADTVLFIPLETTEESFMDLIDQIWINDSYILINCHNAGLLLFQQDGKFVRRIGKPGRGPGEYGRILHFDVLNDTILVSSIGKRGFSRYSFDGIFCDEIRLNYQPLYFTTTADQKLACYCREEGKIYMYNQGLDMPPDTIIVEYGTSLRYKYDFLADKTMTYLQRHSSGLLFYDYISDTVWNIRSKDKQPAFLIEMKDKLPKDKQAEFCNGNPSWNQMVTAYQLIHLLPFQSQLFIYQKHWRGGLFDAIYLMDTRTREIRKFNKTWIYDDIVSRERLWIFDYVYSTEYLVATMYAPEKNSAENHDDLKAAPSPIWLDQMKAVKEDDNPIVVKIKLKKSLNE